ncbi:MAG: sensor histidine kinase, partial [Alkalispirochaetaceae bacterium]
DGHVRVFAGVEQESCLLLRVSDNGVGYTQDIDDLGLQLVELLTDQVEGKLRRLDASGTSIELRVPLKG